MPDLTPSQTVGPFFAFGLIRENLQIMATKMTPGEAIVVEGHVLDSDGEPIIDAMIEIWQADAEGNYISAPWKKIEGGTFTGFGRSPTTETGYFRFETIKPGATPHPEGGTQAPYLAVSVFARGMLNRLITRIYFDDETATANDPVLGLVDPARRATLIAKKSQPTDDTRPVFNFDIRFGGKDETVFFEA